MFNHLTGLRAKTGNYPGVTVGRSVGTTKVDGVEVAIEDLPGTYSLDPISPDEQVVADLLGGEVYGDGPPDAIVIVADATTLHRSIILVAQVLRQDLPCLLALTMTDELTARGGGISIDALSTALGVPVLAVDRQPRRGHRHLARPTGWPSISGNGPRCCPRPTSDAIDAWGTVGARGGRLCCAKT